MVNVGEASGPGEPVPVKVLIPLYPIAHPIAHLIPKKKQVLEYSLNGDVEILGKQKSWILAPFQHFAMILRVI